MKHVHETHEHDHHVTDVEHAAHACDGAGHQHHHHEDGTCCCEQHAKEFHGIDKPMLARLIFAAICYLICLLFPVNETVELILMILCALSAGYDIALTAIRNLFRAKIFDEYFLMTFAAVAAFAIGEAEEGAVVFLLYRIGAFCQSYAIRHSRRTIYSMTGECSCETDEDKVNNQFITSFARVYTPLILIFAVLIAVLLPLVTEIGLRDSVYRALTFLVLACPCAIVISVPLAYFAGIAAASRSGLFFSNSDALDAAADRRTEQPSVNSREVNGQTFYRCCFHDTESGLAELVMKNVDDYSKAVRIAKRTRLIAKENVIFTILIKLTVLLLSVCGISALWFAVFADSGVTVIVVLNALRAFRPIKSINK